MGDLTYTRQGNDWVFNDGSRLPVVAGGSDAGTAVASADIDAVLDSFESTNPEPTDVQTPAAPAPPAAADPAAAGAPDAAATPAASATPDAGDGWLATLPEDAAKEIRRLRQEAGDYRTRAKTFEERFEGLEDGERDFLLDFVRDIRNPETSKQAAERMAEALGLSAPESADADLADLEGLDDDLPLTAAQVQRMLDERDQSAAAARRAEDEKRNAEQAVTQIGEKAQALGYDLESADYVTLLWHARHKTNGDLAEADKALKADRQRIIDEHIAGKAAEADGSAVTAPQEGGPPSNLKPIKSLKDADDALDAHLDAIWGPKR